MLWMPDGWLGGCLVVGWWWCVLEIDTCACTHVSGVWERGCTAEGPNLDSLLMRVFFLDLCLRVSSLSSESSERASSLLETGSESPLYQAFSSSSDSSSESLSDSSS